MPTFFKHNCMSEILSLQGLIIDKVEKANSVFLIHVHVLRKNIKCPCCNSTKGITKHGIGKTRKVRHGLSVENIPMYLEFKSKRYKCKKCNKTFTISLPESILKPRKRFTNLCINQIMKTLKISNFNITKKETGSSYYLMNKGLDEFYEKNRIIGLPKCSNLTIGIDGHSRAGHTMATTITLIRPTRKPLGILPRGSSSEIVNFFRDNITEEERLRVDEISMDMTNDNLGIFKFMLPNAKIVIDKFHVIKHLNNMLSKEHKFEFNMKNVLNHKNIERKGIGTRLPNLIYMHEIEWSYRGRKKMDEIFLLYPNLKYLYDVKEKIREIYNKNISSKEEWLEELNKLPKEYSRTLIKRLDEILNYYTNKTTNAYTEGLHTKIKMYKRLSYGIRNPETYVKKMFLSVIST